MFFLLQKHFRKLKHTHTKFERCESDFFLGRTKGVIFCHKSIAGNGRNSYFFLANLSIMVFTEIS